MGSDDFTVESLRIYIEALLRAHADLDDNRHREAERGLAVASSALDKRLDSMNAFRDQLNLQQSQYITRAEFELAHTGLIREVEMIRSVSDQSTGRRSVVSERLLPTIAILVSLATTTVFILITVLGGR
jgi:hypothetical protein